MRACRFFAVVSVAIVFGFMLAACDMNHPPNHWPPSDTDLVGVWRHTGETVVEAHITEERFTFRRMSDGMEYNFGTYRRDPNVANRFIFSFRNMYGTLIHTAQVDTNVGLTQFNIWGSRINSNLPGGWITFHLI